MNDQHALAQQLLDEPLWGWTILTDPAWRKAWDAVPRAAFAPDEWFTWTGEEWLAHRRDVDESAWADAVHQYDEPFITQVTGNAPSCSLSAPYVVSAMLAALDVRDGMTVLESGAGCGWTAALMCARLGDRNVTTIEFDPDSGRFALQRLAAAGFGPGVRLGDGEQGWAHGAPFDRVSATHAVRRIPRAWIEQTRPGGLVCAPLKVGRNLDLFVRLLVDSDGSASGGVLFPLSFMPSRSHPTPAASELADDPKRTAPTSLDVPALLDGGNAWVLKLAIPGVRIDGPELEDGDDTVWLTAPDGCWAVGYTPAGASWVNAVADRYGERDVWALAEAAFAQWDAAGSPGLDEYGLSVSADGVHTLWMKDPGNVVTVLAN